VPIASRLSWRQNQIITVVMGRANQQLRRVLVAVDLSRPSDHLLRRTLLLPLAAEAHIDIFHVLRGDTVDEDGRIRKQREAELIRLKDLAETASRTSPLSVTATTAIGKPALEIVARAQALGPDLVVIGQDPDDGKRRSGLGPIAKFLLRESGTPLLMVVLDPIEPYRRVMVAVDLSDASIAAAVLAAKILGPARNAEVSLMHVYRVPFEGWLRETGLGAQFKVAAAADLGRLLHKLGEGARTWRPILGKGDAGPHLFFEAKRRRADLIVLGAHSHSGFWRASAAAVTDWLLPAANYDIAVTAPLCQSSRHDQCSTPSPVF
jgi:nucleotide-binding universal stress UspA family protein